MNIIPATLGDVVFVLGLDHFEPFQRSTMGAIIVQSEALVAGVQTAAVKTSAFPN